MAIISEEEFQSARGWRLLPEGDIWTEKSSAPVVSTHWLTSPGEVGLAQHTLALRYGECWIAGHYVEVALRLGAVRLTGRTTPAFCPGICLMMPLDMHKECS